jgi:hypothetical protein
MRRGFWLVTGAVIGVTGYRRAARLGRTLTGQRPGVSTLQAARRPSSPIQLRWRSPLVLSMRAPASRTTPARPAARIASAAGFVKDVHEGMAEYWDLHRGEIDRTLGTQYHPSTLERRTPQQASSGAREGHREP